MKESVLNQLKEKHNSSGGKSGTRLTELKGDYLGVRKSALELFKEGKIIVREGINGKLLFLK